MAPRRSLGARFWSYQAVRFPLPGFIPLVTAFAFSSAAYSRVVRGAPGFIPWERFAVGAITALVFFFMLRVLDEHKDAEVDARYRPELPVPSGLISLAELRWIGGSLVALTVVANALLAPPLLLAYLVVVVWASLMTKEFFVREWLRTHPTAYLLTHMAIMPAIDLYTTGLDWLAEGQPAPHGLVAFLIVTFLNGVLIEVGRKLRAPGEEREGVDTYTRAWGLRAAPTVWIATLLGSAGFAWLAARDTGTAGVTLAFLIPAALLCAWPAVSFLRRPDRRSAAQAETASQLWPLFTYLLLGAAPYVMRLLGSAR
ncbi:MAG: UbiA family prenyltransferase [Candidatus Eisenbacteria bacterium]|nr:UbiA family prenyltransferase [Candidatus Eisenbacteria bacterium]MCC7142642.1 UbiA family prenyltransferase [Candidatus Eisenbacteria bacterium]